jgi:hypothetical protein
MIGVDAAELARQANRQILPLRGETSSAESQLFAADRHGVGITRISRYPCGGDGQSDARIARSRLDQDGVRRHLAASSVDHRHADAVLTLRSLKNSSWRGSGDPVLAGSRFSRTIVCRRSYP